MDYSRTKYFHSGGIREVKVQHYDYAVGKLKLQSFEELLEGKGKEQDWLTLSWVLPIAALLMIDTEYHTAR